MSQSNSADPVFFAVSDGVATITLNRPESLNSMNNPLMRGVLEGLRQVEKDDSIRVVILTGSGRGFCAGADLASAAEGAGSSDESGGRDAAAGMDEYFNPAVRALHDCPVPTIARVQGPAAGGGFGLSLACDITVASKSAFFVATFSPRLGIVPDMGTTWSLPTRAGRARAMGICLLGDRISAEQAVEWGLIWACVDDTELDAEVARIASLLKRSSPDAVRRVRQSIDAAQHNTFSEQLDLEMNHQAVLIPRNMQEGARAFMEKREPVFDGRRE